MSMTNSDGSWNWKGWALVIAAAAAGVLIPLWYFGVFN